MYVKHTLNMIYTLTLSFCRYKLRSEFASDARLVFNNCQTFNEDDSEVGVAGHSMRRFFEKRWKDFGGDGDLNLLKPS